MKQTLVFFTGSKAINEANIKNILPHRGRMLLLNDLDINEERILGRFMVTNEVCDGHAVFNGRAVLKGSDLFDMSAQLLAVSWAVEHPDKGQTCLPRKYGGARFKKTIFPGELLTIEIKIEDIMVEILNLKENKETIFLSGERFLIRVGDSICAEILGVCLAIL